MTTASIVGIGTWLPKVIRSNSYWPEKFVKHQHGTRTFNDIPPSDDPAAAALVARDLEREANDPFLGAIFRHVADADMTAPEAESLAALRALAAAGIDPKDVDVVLSQSMIPDLVGIPTGPPVAHRIGAVNARALGVDAVCASSVAQLEVARAYVESGLAKIVVLVQSHLLLRTMPMLHPASPGLGDGATALVVSTGKGLALRSTYTRTHGEYAAAVTFVRDNNDDTPWFRPGGEYRLGSRRPDLTKVLMRETVAFGARTLREAAATIGIDLARVSTLASVQPRGFLPAAIAEHAGLQRTAAVTTYERIAHVGACGPIFNLEEAQKQGRLERGALIALYGQGAGFTRSVAILEG